MSIGNRIRKNNIFSNFKKSDGRVYFRKSLRSPYEEIAPDKVSALRDAISQERRRMLHIVFVFGAVLLLATLSYPLVLTLEDGLGLIVAGVFMLLALAPFIFMLLVHTMFKKKIRFILKKNHNQDKVTLSFFMQNNLRLSLGYMVYVVLFLMGISGVTLSSSVLILNFSALTNREIMWWSLGFCLAIGLSFLTTRSMYNSERRHRIKTPHNR